MLRSEETQLAINIMAREWSNAVAAYSLNRSAKGRGARNKGAEYMGRLDDTKV